MVLDHDGYAKEQAVTIADDLSRIVFTVENRTGGPHTTGLTIAGLPAGDYTVSVDGKRVGTVRGSDAEATIALPIGAPPIARVEIAR